MTYKSLCAVKGVTANGVKEGKFGLALTGQAGLRQGCSRRTSPGPHR